ncbi:glycosyltransferase [Desulfolutivibrio sulfoxidireducens]|uniref:glycosyltransferase n=1 Tax=Desulfolutivibrio sulfoxidireducens TaxID=2773299 RepID=UPI00159E0248|nr:glycosyltransferase [Desulfolutivibrio sulfoxidireducens]QLA20144.1 glycosyltransferase [Desulfolutivibrio sulfoxidireducens]
MPTEHPDILIYDSLRCHLVSNNPIIIISYGYPFAAPSRLCPYLRDRTAYFLMGNWWSLRDTAFLKTSLALLTFFKHTYTKHTFIYLTNEPEESHILNGLGIDNLFCNQNAFIDERIFRIDPGQEKKYDAVYTARPESFKRHLLAKELNNWLLLYHQDQTKIPQETRYIDMLQRKMPQMIRGNNIGEQQTYVKLTPPQMTAYYNQSRVGLCLSDIEGSNYSTTEYMLCGLPVVSTENIGGRNCYLDQDIARIVSPDARAVKQGVDELIAAAIPGNVVRKRTLIKMHRHRQNFIRYIQGIYASHDSNRDFSSEWDDVFVNKMHRYPANAETFLKGHGLV